MIFLINLKKKIILYCKGSLAFSVFVLIDTIMDGSECGFKISLMTKRLPTELVNVKTADTENLDEKEIVSVFPVNRHHTILVV